MKIEARVATRHALAAACAALVGVAISSPLGCNSDDPSNTMLNPPPSAQNTDASSPASDASVDPRGADASTGRVPDGGGDVGAGGDAGDARDASRRDASADASADATGDASVDAAPAKGFCEGQAAGLAFCADFDSATALTPGGTGWDLVLNAGTNLSTSSARSVSAPGSLLVALTTATGGEAKLVKKVTQSVLQATYEFDLYLEQLPVPAAGGFITDFQFSDTDGAGNAAADTFGFRISAFSNAAGQLERASLEHNAPAIPNAGPDDIQALPLTFGAWNHVKLVASFSTAAGGNKVSFQAYLDRSPVPAIDKIYDAPFASAPFARIAQGVVFPFNGASKDFKLTFDNVTLKLQ